MVIIEGINACRSEIRIFRIHRASFAKHIKSKKHSEDAKQYEMNIKKPLFQDHIENKPKKYKILKIYQE